MSVNEFMRLLPDVEIRPEQLACCYFLESKGQRFCIEFGYDNAQAKVWDIVSDQVGVNHQDPDFDYDAECLRQYEAIVLGPNTCFMA